MCGELMRVEDTSAGIVLATDAVEATSYWSRFRGLMLRKELRPGEGLIIRPCGSIHMMFMRFRIDAVFFDDDLKVTKVASSVARWRGMAFGGRGAAGVIELPSGAAAGVEAGHQLSFIGGSSSAE